MRPGVFRTVLVMVEVDPSGLTRVSVVIVSSMMQRFMEMLQYVLALVLVLSTLRVAPNLCFKPKELASELYSSSSGRP
jgi:hypothetical protein